MKKMWENQEAILTKLLLSHLVIALELQSWSQSNAKTKCFYLMGRYENKGLGSLTGFFSPVLCQKFKHNLQSYQLVFLLFEYLCAPNIQKN